MTCPSRVTIRKEKPFFLAISAALSSSRTTATRPSRDSTIPRYRGSNRTKSLPSPTKAGSFSSLSTTAGSSLLPFTVVRGRRVARPAFSRFREPMARLAASSFSTTTFCMEAPSAVSRARAQSLRTWMRSVTAPSIPLSTPLRDCRSKNLTLFWKPSWFCSMASSREAFWYRPSISRCMVFSRSSCFSRAWRRESRFRSMAFSTFCRLSSCCLAAAERASNCCFSPSILRRLSRQSASCCRSCSTRLRDSSAREAAVMASA